MSKFSKHKLAHETISDREAIIWKGQIPSTVFTMALSVTLSLGKWVRGGHKVSSWNRRGRSRCWPRGAFSVLILWSTLPRADREEQ
jgi:hypothetical protein